MSDDKFFTSKQLAEKFHAALGCGTASAAYHKLVRLRMNGTGPRYSKPGGVAAAAVYRESEFNQWLESRTYSNPSEERAALRAARDA